MLELYAVVLDVDQSNCSFTLDFVQTVEQLVKLCAKVLDLEVVPSFDLLFSSSSSTLSIAGVACCGGLWCLCI